MLVSGKGSKQGRGSPCEGVRKGKKSKGRQFPWVKGENDVTRGDRDLVLIRDGPCGVSSQDIRRSERWNKAILLVKWFTVCGGRTRRLSEGRRHRVFEQVFCCPFAWKHSLEQPSAVVPFHILVLLRRKACEDGNLRSTNQPCLSSHASL